MSDIFLSVVIPAYNESKRIGTTLESLSNYFKDKPYKYEIIVVNDGSKDATSDVVKSYRSLLPSLVFIDLTTNKGKGNAVREGMNAAKGRYRLFMDADNSVTISHFDQFLPHIEQGGCDVVIGSIMLPGSNVTEQNGIHRRILSMLSKLPVRMLATPGIHDTQRGFKLFTKKAAEEIFGLQTIERFGFDIELLVIARRRGLKVKELPVIWINPEGSTVTLADYHKTMIELGRIVYNNIRGVYGKKKSIRHLIPFASHIEEKKGKGFHYKGEEFVHHTDLHHHETAFYTLIHSQKVIFSVLGLFVVLLFVLNWHLMLILAFAALTALYFIDLLFNGFVIYRSFSLTPEIHIPQEDINKVRDEDLPTYTIFCPLYREWRVVPQFVKAMHELDYPKEKLQIMFLLEENDAETIEKIREANLPEHFEIVVVPHSKPKTKPKAMNYGLQFAKGEYLVIYDAEDIPEPDQLKKAALAFKDLSPATVCVQAKLNFYNTHQNLMTRIFTAEYSLWFDLVLPGLQSLRAPIPLGGTSNHFRVASLKMLSGWDAFNVTEDCDLGMRIARRGFQTAIIQSTTFEEANSRIKNWYNQRSRWIKGYIQTYLVHTRQLHVMLRQKRYRELLSFQLTVGGKILSMFINPVMWFITACYFLLRTDIGPFIETLFPDPVLYLGVFSLVFGNFLYLYYYMVGCAKRGQYDLVKYVFVVPFYWLAMSVAAWKALYEVVVKPHYWAKTIHGLHLTKEKHVSDEVQKETRVQLASHEEKQSFAPSAGSLVVASMIANFANLLFSTYASRSLTLEEFGILSALNSVVSLFGIVISSCSTAVVHRVSFLVAKWGKGFGKNFFEHVRYQWFVGSAFLSVVWIFFTPQIASYLQISNLFLVAVLGPTLIVGVLDAIYRGYLQGNLLFGSVAIATLFEVGVKLLAAYGLVESGNTHLFVLTLPISVAGAFLATLILALWRGRSVESKQLPTGENIKVPYGFLLAAFLTNISAVLFLSVDVVMAKHYLDPALAGGYGLLSLAGKMIFFFGTILNMFIVTLVSRDEGRGKNPRGAFGKIFAGMVLSTTAATGGLIMTAPFLMPFLFGENTRTILEYIAPYSFATAFLTVANTIVTYHLARRRYSFSVVSIIAALLMVVGIGFYHSSIEEIVRVVLVSNAAYLVAISLMHAFYSRFALFIRNLRDIFGVIAPLPEAKEPVQGKRKILVFNWRDMKHVYAGGAELYIETLAREWVKDGHSVTLFCGNDGRSARNEEVQGVQIIRRGGFYTLYFCALLYYIFRFRGKFDAVVDCENGIPFFIPPFAKEPVVCLVHHVHQEVFRKSLSAPLAFVASTLESRVMPLVYRHATFVTVSESSRKDLSEFFSSEKVIEVVNPGVDLGLLKPGKKHDTPLVSYVGRLKQYKSIDVLIRAFAHVLAAHKDAALVIAGDGEERGYLETIARKAGLLAEGNEYQKGKVSFLGKISEEEKIRLLQSSWISVNPSSMEGWGITTIEANACGTPVIASNVPGLRDSVSNHRTGILVPWGDVDALSKQLVHLIGDEDMRNNLAKGALEWAQNFSWESASRKFGKVVQSEIERVTSTDKVATPIVPQTPPAPLTVTIGIPTCYGGISLVPTIESIKASTDVKIDRIIVVSDRTPISPAIVSQLKERGVEVYWNEKEGSNPKKLKQMLDMCTTDLFITTQDDVIFEPTTVKRIVDSFNEGKHVTMVCSYIAPLEPRSFTESVMSAVIRIPGRIARYWNGGDNHLAASGRCMAFRTEFMRTYRVPEEIVNGDMFFYIENKRLGGIMKFATESIAYIRSPESLKDQIGPSSRYQVSQSELSPYFTHDISSEYAIPFWAGVGAFFVELIQHPINTSLYLFVFVYTRLYRQDNKKATNPLWDVDITTKFTV